MLMTSLLDDCFSSLSNAFIKIGMWKAASKNWKWDSCYGGKDSNLFACITYYLSIIRSELIWALYVVSQNLSYSSCNNIKATLKVKFLGIIPEIFSTSSSKIRSNWSLFQFSEVATGGFLLKSFANLTGKYLCWSLSSIKLQWSATLFKRDSNIVVFLWISWNF